jgi:hypothetical protein
MNLNLHQYLCLLTPIVLIQFAADYLSDSRITHSETKLGIYQLFHQLIATIIGIGTLALPFVTRNINVVAFNATVFLIVQLGFLKNNDYCWLTRRVNVIIDPSKPNTKWTGRDIIALAKRYIRGDSWTYTDIRDPKCDQMVLILNSVFLLELIKINLKK